MSIFNNRIVYLLKIKEEDIRIIINNELDNKLILIMIIESIKS